MRSIALNETRGLDGVRRPYGARARTRVLLREVADLVEQAARRGSPTRQLTRKVIQAAEQTELLCLCGAPPNASSQAVWLQKGSR